jgi:hypothetical protein
MATTPKIYSSKTYPSSALSKDYTFPFEIEYSNTQEMVLDMNNLPVYNVQPVNPDVIIDIPNVTEAKPFAKTDNSFEEAAAEEYPSFALEEEDMEDDADSKLLSVDVGSEEVSEPEASDDGDNFSYETDTGELIELQQASYIQSQKDYMYVLLERTKIWST